MALILGCSIVSDFSNPMKPNMTSTKSLVLFSSLDWTCSLMVFSKKGIKDLTMLASKISLCLCTVLAQCLLTVIFESFIKGQLFHWERSAKPRWNGDIWVLMNWKQTLMVVVFVETNEAGIEVVVYNDKGEVLVALSVIGHKLNDPLW